eukprot:2139259-Rhodomonas_salina.2
MRAHAATRLRFQSPSCFCCSVSGTDAAFRLQGCDRSSPQLRVSSAICLRTRYIVLGTDAIYPATHTIRHFLVLTPSILLRTRYIIPWYSCCLSCYAHATLPPVLTARTRSNMHAPAKDGSSPLHLVCSPACRYDQIKHKKPPFNAIRCRVLS